MLRMYVLFIVFSSFKHNIRYMAEQKPWQLVGGSGNAGANDDDDTNNNANNNNTNTNTSVKASDSERANTIVHYLLQGVALGTASL